MEAYGRVVDRKDKQLLEKGADAKEKAIDDEVLWAVSHGGHKQVLQPLLGKGADVNAQGGNYGNTLQTASHGGHERVVQLLLIQKQDLDQDLTSPNFRGKLEASRHRQKSWLLRSPTGQRRREG